MQLIIVPTWPCDLYCTSTCREVGHLEMLLGRSDIASLYLLDYLLPLPRVISLLFSPHLVSAVIKWKPAALADEYLEAP